ncbi:DUF4386 domain-containing protein [Nocardioides taihuensis]|uniref:DUF4386 domain-containing protein n=1 Tax=Nocardioides taihuensis TaxID=1835606 RepID=A0ABW0BD67_9ACTN
MTTTTTAPVAPRTAPVRASDSALRHARVAGLLYLITFAASIPALPLIAPLLDDPAAYVLGPGHDTQVLAGCLLDVVNALTAIGTAVAVFPVVRRVNQSLALGFVISRTMEAAVIMTGVVSLMAVVTLRQDLGSDAAGLATTAQALVDVRDWTFLFGPGLMPALNALLFGTLLHKSGLVPRWIPTLGLIGAPLLITAAVLVVFGHLTLMTGPALLLTLPIAVWELSVGTYMLVKGFRPTPYSVD